ncbi:hypothetical protein ILYODFUR_031713 [Ilyodon furcidens]|uniref:Uncharacterized protein n=1 Tax=Ilyodon furcidens TaxID=33524 RepID=A0ABV0UL66_9TELE
MMTIFSLLSLIYEVKTVKVPQTCKRKLFFDLISCFSDQSYFQPYPFQLRSSPPHISAPHQFQDKQYLVLDDLLGDLDRLGSHGLGGAQTLLGGTQPFTERLQGFVELKSQNLHLLQLPLPETEQRRQTQVFIAFTGLFLVMQLSLFLETHFVKHA